MAISKEQNPHIIIGGFPRLMTVKKGLRKAASRDPSTLLGLIYTEDMPFFFKGGKKCLTSVSPEPH